jgi:RimJ/RimL family protein N-acetyltransferase
MKQTLRPLAGLSAEKKSAVILHSLLEFGRNDIQTMTRLQSNSESEVPGESPGMHDTLTVPTSATSPGLLLRPWTEQDIPAMVAAYRDPVMRHWLRHPVTTTQEAQRIIQARHADRRAGTGFSFAVLQADADGAAGDLVGGISIRRLDREAVSGEVGYWVTASSRGQGIAPRALNAACEWAFRLPRRRPLERLELIHAVGNHSSCRVADKTGFALTAVLPPLLPDFPNDGHLHIRLAGGRRHSSSSDPKSR